MGKHTGRNLAIAGGVIGGGVAAILLAPRIIAMMNYSLTMTPSSSSVTTGGTVTFTGTLKTTAGVAVANEAIALYVGSSSVATTSTDTFGSYSLTYSFGIVGSYPCYAAATALGVNSPGATIVVTAAGIGSISLNSSATTITVGGTVNFTGTVVDTNGNGLPGVALYVFESNAVVPGVTPTSGAGGAYSFALSFASAGTYSIDVSSNAANT